MNPASKARMTLVAEVWFVSCSTSSTSSEPLHTLCPVFRILPRAFGVLTLMILFAASPDDSGWWPSVSDSSLGQGRFGGLAPIITRAKIHGARGRSPMFPTGVMATEEQIHWFAREIN